MYIVDVLTQLLTPINTVFLTAESIKYCVLALQRNNELIVSLWSLLEYPLKIAMSSESLGAGVVAPALKCSREGS